MPDPAFLCILIKFFALCSSWPIMARQRRCHWAPRRAGFWALAAAAVLVTAATAQDEAAWPGDDADAECPLGEEAGSMAIGNRGIELVQAGDKRRAASCFWRAADAAAAAGAPGAHAAAPPAARCQPEGVHTAEPRAPSRAADGRAETEQIGWLRNAAQARRPAPPPLPYPCPQSRLSESRDAQPCS